VFGHGGGDVLDRGGDDIFVVEYGIECLWDVERTRQAFCPSRK
jgi:hypothetical protein